uniref:Uncharacterized protein n=1 Tax=Tanacetum cinerariifolium TaxID=118510 RepID=A0A699HKS4_TANCI|nr:hypothetical protein [Tanacetum cinerariifolium]
MHTLTENHWSAFKRILRYLHGMVEHGMLIRRSSGSTLQAFTDLLWKANLDTFLEAFTDADWAGDSDDRWRVSLSDAWVTRRDSPYYPVDNMVVAVRDVDVLPRCPILCLLLFLVWSRVTICRVAVRERGLWSLRSLPLCVDYDPCGAAGLMFLAAVCQLYFLRSGRCLAILVPFRCGA